MASSVFLCEAGTDFWQGGMKLLDGPVPLQFQKTYIVISNFAYIFSKDKVLSPEQLPYII